MEHATRTLNGWGEVWSSTTLHIAWQAALLAGVVLLIVRFGRRLSSPLRYTLCLLALAKFVVPPTLSASIGVFSLAGPTVESAAPADHGPSGLALAATHTSPRRDSPIAAPDSIPSATEAGAAAATTFTARAEPGLARSRPAADVARSRLTWAAGLMLLHALGVLVGLGWLVRQARALRRLERDSEPVVDGPMHDALVHVSRRLGLRRAPRLLVARRAGPAAFGLRTPRVVVPEIVRALSGPEQATVLAHEAAHHRRRDLWALWAQTLVQVLWWFHPAVWILGRALRTTREECCDDLLLAKGIASQESYCDTLLRTASFLAIAEEPALMAGMSRQSLTRRFRRIMAGEGPRAAGLSRSSFLVVLAAAFLALPGLSTQDAGGATNDEDPPAVDPAAQVFHDIRGRVTTPGGEPAESVELFLARKHVMNDIVEWRRLGTADSDGAFEFRLSERELKGVHGYYRVLIARAPGFGPAWVKVEDEVAESHALQLFDEYPIRGRVIDLEGRPVAGARVRPFQVLDTHQRSLDTWLAALEADRTKATGRVHLRMPVNLNQPGHDEPAVTDADGEFVLHGIGAEQVVRVVVEGDTIASEEISVVTRDVPTFEASWWEHTPRTYYSPEFEYIAAPTRPVVGRVTDLQTGEGIAGAVVTSIGGSSMNLVRTVTDADGNYRLIGLPKADGYWVRIEDSMETGYMSGDAEIPNPPGLDPIVQNLELLPAVIVNVTVREAATGEPVEEVAVMYSASGSNPNMRNRILSYGHMPQTDFQGKATLLALPGKGSIALWATRDYLTLSEVHDEPLDEGASLIVQPKHSLQGLRVIEPEMGTRTLDLVIELVKGSEVEVAFADASGQALSGVQILGEKRPFSWGREATSGDVATLSAFNEERPRLVLAVHEERELVGRLDASVKAVTMEPGGAIVGRLTDEDDLACGGATILVEFSPAEEAGYVRYVPTHVKTEEDGTFRVAPVIPGLTYRLSLSDEFMMGDAQAIARDLVVEAGETLDVGDVSAEREQ